MDDYQSRSTDWAGFGIFHGHAKLPVDPNPKPPKMKIKMNGGRKRETARLRKGIGMICKKQFWLDIQSDLLDYLQSDLSLEWGK
jgi:hypothetical protein